MTTDAQRAVDEADAKRWRTFKAAEDSIERHMTPEARMLGALEREQHPAWLVIGDARFRESVVVAVVPTATGTDVMYLTVRLKDGREFEVPNTPPSATKA